MRFILRTIRDQAWHLTPAHALAFALAVGALAVTSAQGVKDIRVWDDGVKYDRGQNVVPVFEGWVPNPDGTFSLVFGSWNRNWQETLYIPIGPDNTIAPGPIDQGQPTAFGPRRDSFRFEIVVPKDFGKKEIVWTITSRGRTEKAYGSLIPQQVLTRRMVRTAGSLNAAAMNGNDDVESTEDPNSPPAITFVSPPEGQSQHAVMLSASVADDGYEPGDRAPRAMRYRWSEYRASAPISFDKADGTLSGSKGGRVDTAATFSRPGTYVVRLLAVDGAGLETKQNVTVHVK